MALFSEGVIRSETGVLVGVGAGCGVGCGAGCGVGCGAGCGVGCGVGCGADISDLMQACGETDPVRIFFSEVPGAVIQVRDSDFDYIDAEFLLQDVAYYPLGHPTADGRLHLCTAAKTGIQTILESLMQNAEGED